MGEDQASLSISTTHTFQTISCSVSDLLSQEALRVRVGVAGSRAGHPVLRAVRVLSRDGHGASDRELEPRGTAQGRDLHAERHHRAALHEVTRWW